VTYDVFFVVAGDQPGGNGQTVQSCIPSPRRGGQWRSSLGGTYRDGVLRDTAYASPRTRESGCPSESPAR
jgi:hypothetical protein